MRASEDWDWRMQAQRVRGSCALWQAQAAYGQAQTRLRWEQGCQRKGHLIHQELQGAEGFPLTPERGDQ